MLEVVNLGKTYANLPVLRDVSFHIREGEILGLMAPSGCGKSTLARIALGLIPADSGQVLYRGTNIAAMRGNALRAFRREAQLISQRPESSFDPSMRLGKSVLEPLRILRLPGADQLNEILERVKLDDSLLVRYPHQVSGGEIQRLALSRALLLKPKLLVLDEATSMLDVSVQAQILHILKDLQQDMGLACLFISHDRLVLEWMTNRIMEWMM